MIRWWVYCSHPKNFDIFLATVKAENETEAKEIVKKDLPGLTDYEKHTMRAYKGKIS